MILRVLVIAFIGAALFSACSSSAHPTRSWPSSAAAPPVPAALGVNIHFTDPKPGELAMISAAGFRWIRTDFVWQDTEQQKGKYDFSAYDRLITALEQRQLRAVFILDYTNRLYDEDHAPYTDSGRTAFAAWARAAVTHFKGHDIVWEIYNEPNTGFWTPKPDVANYIKLALETSSAIHQAAPNEQLVGPSVWGFDFEFLEACFRAGLLNYWTAVSVHPYRKTEPETVVEDYARLRRLIAKYAPANKNLSIISSEWGYSSASFNVGEQKQAELLVRQAMINQSQGIPISIWYDWRDDGREPREIEHHFGTVFPRHYSERDPIYDPKPAYLAVQTFTKFLAACSFSERIYENSLHEDDYLLAFRCGDKTRYAAWTTGWLTRPVSLPLASGRYRLLSATGKSAFADTDSNGLNLMLTGSPQYFERAD